ncbi:hypothetical protein Ancab_014367 [Ancistrocladus abbreviatus]
MKIQKQPIFNCQTFKDSDTFGLIIQIYAKSNKLNRGKELHGRLIRAGYKPSKYVDNHLLSLYAKCGQLGYAQKLFDRMRQRNLVSWTAMITALAQSSRSLEAIKTFCRMRVSGQRPLLMNLGSWIFALKLEFFYGSFVLMDCLLLTYDVKES